jgi:predicted lysophospholipase L1 biosynthesis ABC-type transport system permease subunit
VAAFNLVSPLVMVVTDKHPDLAILRTLGASPGSIMKLFMVQGVVIGMVGTILGVATGIVTAFNIDTVVPAIERLFHFQILSREVYYISELPSDLHWGDVVWTAVISLGLSFVATLYPSWRAARVNPAEALRRAAPGAASPNVVLECEIFTRAHGLESVARTRPERRDAAGDARIARDRRGLGLRQELPLLGGRAMRCWDGASR